jgi:hypothetical protein
MDFEVKQNGKTVSFRFNLEVIPYRGSTSGFFIIVQDGC